LNPHNPFGSADFKSAASASFAIPAWEEVGNLVSHAARVVRHTPTCKHVVATDLADLTDQAKAKSNRELRGRC
jgi:hypothetical protein